MPFALHAIQVPDNGLLNYYDRLVVAGKIDVANAAGGGAGDAVTTTVTFATGALPASYLVMVSPSQACFVNVGSKTHSGFDVTLTPVDGSTTLAAGTFDVLVVA